MNPEDRERWEAIIAEYFPEQPPQTFLQRIGGRAEVAKNLLEEALTGRIRRFREIRWLDDQLTPTPGASPLEELRQAWRIWKEAREA